MSDADATPRLVVYLGTSPESADAMLRGDFQDAELIGADGCPSTSVLVASDSGVAGAYGEVVLAVELDAETAPSVAEQLMGSDVATFPFAALDTCRIRRTGEP
jgi:hypothetical protein